MQAEARRSEKRAAIEDAPKVGSRFSRDTTVTELIEWWRESVARHQVKTSTFDSYRRFGGDLADDIGGLAVVEVGAGTTARNDPAFTLPGGWARHGWTTISIEHGDDDEICELVADSWDRM